MALHHFCDGLRRRDFLKAGALGGFGLSLASYLRLAKAGEIAPAKGRSAIYINLSGGPTHLDTFDLKPDAPAEIRGEFKPIKTNVSGMEICEHMPKLAKCADKYIILRGVSHSIAAHNLGTDYMNTGNRPLPSLDYPSYGAVVSKELPAAAGLPSFVAIPNTSQRPGYLGVQYAALETNATPLPGKPFSVRGITLGRGLTVSDVEKRQRLLADLDTAFKGYEQSSNLLEGLDEFSRQAHDIITSPKARAAFDVSQEKPAIAERFGTHGFGQSCLLACRLVEAGVRFATVSFGGWDTHGNNFQILKNGKLAQLDDGLSALFTTLAEKRLARFDLGLRDRRIRPHAKDQPARRPRPLAAGHVRAPRRRRHESRPSDRRERRQSDGPRRRTDHARPSRRLLLPQPRHRLHQGIPHPHRPPRHARPQRRAGEGTVRVNS